MGVYTSLGQRVRGTLFCGASFVFTALIVPPAFAQQAGSDASGNPVSTESTASTDDIVVTGSRVIRDGFKALTPTSVIGAAEINARAPANIADFVNTLSALAGSATPRSTGSFTSAGTIGINAPNLRNLNPNRTLVLLDGQRVGASALSGAVDVNPPQPVHR